MQLAFLKPLNVVKSYNLFYIMIITATHDTTRGTTHQHRSHGSMDKAISQKIEITDGSAAVSSTILETPEDDQCWSKYVVCIHK
jgi:hypothetical protein